MLLYFACSMLSVLWYCVNSSSYGYFDGIHPVVLWQISSYLYIAVKHNRFYLLNLKLHATCFSPPPASGIKVCSSKTKWTCIISKPTGHCSPRRLICLILENKGSWILQDVENHMPNSDAENFICTSKHTRQLGSRWYTPGLNIVIIDMLAFVSLWHQVRYPAIE